MRTKPPRRGQHISGPIVLDVPDEAGEPTRSPATCWS